MLIALAAKPRWIVYDLQELISTWHKRNSPIDNTAETRHQFFTLCYNWLEEIRNAGKIVDPIHKYTGHTDVIEDVAWHMHHKKIFGSVGDDKKLLL